MEYMAEWVKCTNDRIPRLVAYGGLQEKPPDGCFQDQPDLERRCFETQLPLAPVIQVGQDWRAKHVEIRWKKVEE
jgi:hypothetical protein